MYREDHDDDDFLHHLKSKKLWNTKTQEPIYVVWKTVKPWFFLGMLRFLLKTKIRRLVQLGFKCVWRALFDKQNVLFENEEER